MGPFCTKNVHDDLINSEIIKLTHNSLLNSATAANVKLTRNSFPDTSLNLDQFPGISLTAVNFPNISRISRQLLTLHNALFQSHSGLHQEAFLYHKQWKAVFCLCSDVTHCTHPQTVLLCLIFCTRLNQITAAYKKISNEYY